MPWSADAAMRDLWAGLDTTKTNGEVMRYLRDHLQAAYNAGVEPAAQRIEPTNPIHDWTDYARIRADAASSIRELSK